MIPNVLIICLAINKDCGHITWKQIAASYQIVTANKLCFKLGDCQMALNIVWEYCLWTVWSTDMCTGIHVLEYPLLESKDVWKNALYLHYAKNIWSKKVTMLKISEAF